ncbi:CHAP domain-containing protein [Gemella sanguinis]|jgi:surface protein pspC|uniref:PspC family transcriptional regulator n=1 Tax=Gemella sanguinis TaxID=84135 RepID=A0A2N6SEV7_9BACL|nr:CHAP domain-containing protein [Gemella sanguinis]PMC52443.1 PspC family transcriptional regulator [Gemella sanguinis]
MKNNIRLGLGILTVLATPFAVDAATGSNEAHAAQDTVKSVQVAKTTNKEEVKTTTQKQVESATKTEATKVETTKKENTKVEDTKKEATVNKEETTKKDASSEKQASSVKTVSGKPQAPTPNAAEKKTGWTKAGNTWFYYDAQGNQVKNTWVGSYWIGSDGKMVTNSWVDGGKYYVGSQGWWVKDAKKPADAQKSPEKKTGWSKNGNSWYYYDAQGNQIKNAWVGSYWIGSDGKMVTDRWVDGGKYYVGSQGWWEKDAVKKTGWSQTGNTWFLYDNEGNIVKNRWSGNYWLGSDGKMVTNSWVDGGKYYVGADGKWVSDALKPGETRKGWTKAGSTWYFFNDKGNQVKNAWVGNYWIGSDGKMVTNSWVDGGKYYVGNDGKWVKGAATGNGSGALNNVLSIAQSYLGVEMGSAEHKKIVDAYNSVNPKPVGYTVKYSDDWCDVFVTTVFQQAGLSSLIGRECGVQRHIGIMQQKGIWQGKVLPKAGDVITFDWDGGGFADHIGIVESVKDGVVTTIEGNSSPYTSSGNTKVNRKTYNWNASYIKGYARPNY